jgi:hypothetical protein
MKEMYITSICTRYHEHNGIIPSICTRYHEHIMASFLDVSTQIAGQSSRTPQNECTGDMKGITETRTQR